ncbi:MAG: FKBP-type peptidyl-prolyl cis-trans isomerase [Cyclonatronaceae bacterium]
MKFTLPCLLASLLLISGCLQREDFGYDNSADLEFLEEYAQRDDVVITNSGLMYRVIREGEGDVPELDSRVSVHYTASLVSGDVIDSSYERGEPLEFTVGELISGFAEGILLMQEGAEYELVVPPELAYGDFPPQNSNIHPGATLIFEVELLEILEIED